MRRAVIAALIGTMLLLTGCRQPVSLTDRAVVKMICVSGGAAAYRIQLVAFTASDTGEDSKSETMLIEGKGETIKTALLSAQQQLREQLFYAQNELLLIEESTAADSLREILLYFSEERSSRPNMAVFGYAAQQEEKLLQQDGAQQVVDALEKMKDGSGPTTGLTQMIYRFDLTERAENFYLLPRLYIGEGDNIETDALLLFLQEGDPLVLSGEEKQLAELLLGGTDRFEYVDGAKSCTVTNPRITIQVEDQPEPVVNVSLAGAVKDLPLQNDPQELEREIGMRLQTLFSGLYQRCYLERGIDLFHFGWHFLQWNAAAYERPLAENMLFDPQTVRFEPKITVVA